MLEETSQRADAAEHACEGARLALELLTSEVSRCEQREVEASQAAAAARAHVLSVGENEVRLRGALEEQGAQLEKSSREEAVVREALRQAQQRVAEADDEREVTPPEAPDGMRQAEPWP